MGKDKKDVIFKFKKFDVTHGQSSMRVGVDAVLLGSWCDLSNVHSVLDVGTGCGIIALMIAQRLADCEIEGIDIDLASIEEAKDNFLHSPWSDRCQGQHIDFLTYVNLYKQRNKEAIDLIVSNPPYFDSGVKTCNTSRLLARHQGAELSPVVLLREGADLLSHKGRIAIIVPTDIGERLEIEAIKYGLIIVRKCYVRGHDKAPYKRLLMEFGKYEAYVKESSENSSSFLTLKITSGQPTEDYRRLCKDFYLKF